MYLADQGAEVIKVEPLEGDRSRGAGSFARGYLAQNRNKRGISVDIRQPEGRQIVYKLVEQSDVLIHNFRPGVAERLGYDYPTLRKLNRGLIYGWLTGYGPSGPLAQQGGYDVLLQALSGLLARRRLPDGTPTRTGLFVADMSAPMLLAYGISLALLMRHQTGEGQMVTTSLLQGALAMQNTDLVAWEKDGRPGDRASDTHGLNSAYRCQDDQYLVLGIFQNEQWERLCNAVGRQDLTKDDRYRTVAQRGGSAELYEQFCGLFATGTSEDWLAVLNEADVPAAPVLDESGVTDHPQMTANEFFFDVMHPEAGRTRMVSPGVRLSATGAVPRRPAPLLGEHTREILFELGYEEEAVAVLVKDSVVKQAD